MPSPLGARSTKTAKKAGQRPSATKPSAPAPAPSAPTPTPAASSAGVEAGAGAGAAKVLLRCEPCEKEFTSEAARQAHLQSHVPCPEKGCGFSALRKFVNNHHEAKHGQLSGSGFQVRRWRKRDRERERKKQRYGKRQDGDREGEGKNHENIGIPRCMNAGLPVEVPILVPCGPCVRARVVACARAG